MTDQASIHVALAKVMAELPAIGKDGRAAASQGGYAYRGIDQITQHAQGLFAKHGVVIVPSVRSVDVKDIVVAGKPWTDTTLVVDYTLVGPDGSRLDATTVGIGRDNADKGANKAMTQAFKYLLLQVLCISDAKDDGDGHTHEADAQPPREPVKTAARRRAEELFETLRALDDEAKSDIKAWAAGEPLTVPAMEASADLRDQVEAWLDDRSKREETTDASDTVEA